MIWRSLSFKTPELYESHNDIQHTCVQTSQPRKTNEKIENGHSGNHLECIACQEKLNNLHGWRSLRIPKVDLMMFSLPKEGSGSTKRHPTCEESCMPTRNIPALGFRQCSKNLNTKREYIARKSSAPNDTVND